MTDPRHIDYPTTPMVRVYYCACGGMLRPTSQALMVSPPLYVHVCVLCDRTHPLRELSGGHVHNEPYPLRIVADVRETPHD